MITRLILAIALSAGLPALAAEAPASANRFAAVMVPAESFAVGAMQVERHGKGPRALILIPGLASGSWVWQGTVHQFQDEYSIYVVTLPGFDGQPAVPGKQLALARAALLDLIDSRKLRKPVLIGHSLGGALALSLASEAPERIGGVVTIDGLPVFPGAEDYPPAQREQIAQGLKARMAPANKKAFVLQQQQYMRGIGVTDMARADALAELSARSDPAAVMEYMAEVFALDLREALPKITVPVLLVAPYFDLDDTQNQLSEEMKRAYYRSLMEGTPKLDVVSIAPARHFAMFDQPEKLAEILRKYLKAL